MGLKTEENQHNTRKIVKLQSIKKTVCYHPQKGQICNHANQQSCFFQRTNLFYSFLDGTTATRLATHLQILSLQIRRQITLLILLFACVWYHRAFYAPGATSINPLSWNFDVRCIRRYYNKRQYSYGLLWNNQAMVYMITLL